MRSLGGEAILAVAKPDQIHPHAVCSSRVHVTGNTELKASYYVVVLPSTWRSNHLFLERRSLVCEDGVHITRG